MSLYDLEDRSGDIVELMAISRGSDGVADLASLDWPEALTVLRDLTFSRVRLEDVEVRPNLVECVIEDSTFSRLRSRAHFWGAEDRWSRCRFTDVELQDVISPQSRFEDCVFQNVSLVNYHPCETVFSRCTFIDTRFFGMKVEAATGLAKHAELDQGVSTVFSECSLSHCLFENCYFDGVEFRASAFVDVTAENCDFTGVITDKRWWGNSMEGDPFIAFLDEVLVMIKTRLGEKSIALKVMQAYVDDFRSGQTSSKDYSACLFDGRVPYSDLRKIEGALDEIEAKYPV